MTTNVLVALVLLNVILAVFCTWQIERRFPEYYEEIGQPNYGFSGPSMLVFMVGHILVFRYALRTTGVVRVLLVVWSIVLWSMLGGLIVYFG